MAVEIALTAASIWLGSLFVYAGSMKVARPQAHTRRAVDGYRLLPARGAAVVAAVLPYAEFATGLVLLVTPYVRLGAWVVLSFSAIFALASGSVLARGMKTDCGCSGGSSDRVTRVTVARALVMSTAAWAVAASGASIEPVTGWTALGLSVLPAAIVLRRRTMHWHVPLTATSTAVRDDKATA